MKKVPGWKKIEIVCVIIVVAFMSFLIEYTISQERRGEASGHSAVGGIR